MPSLSDLASDLINKAKLAGNSEQKLYNMEQVKEIIFHRDTNLMKPLIPELFELMLERSVAVRRFLVKIAGDALRHDVTLTPHILSLFSFLIVDGNDKILQSIALELSNHYDKISIFVAKMPMKSTGSALQQHHDNSADPRDLWHQLRSMTSVLIETIASNRTEALRIQSLKLCESIILFGLPPSAGSAAKDPRMARATGVRTVLEIPLHHPFIDRNDVEKEADSTLSKMVLWARRGGPQGFRFPPPIMSQLGQSIGAVAAERVDRFKVVVPALIFIIQSPGSVCPQMNAATRQQLSLSLVRVIRAVGGTASKNDPDGLAAKLQEALTELDKLNGPGPASAASSALASLSDVSNADPRKRRLEGAALAEAAAQEILSSMSAPPAPSADRVTDEESEDSDEEDLNGDEELDEDRIRASALAAVDAAESQMISSSNKKMRIDDLLAASSGPLSVSVPASSTSASGMFSPTSASETGCTVPANDLGAFPSDAVTSMRLITLKQTGQVKGRDSTSKEGAVFEAITPPSDVYSELALGTLSKLLSAVIEPTQPPRLKSLLHMQLLLRTVLAMAKTDINTVQNSGGNNNSTVLNIAVLKSRSVSTQLLGDANGQPRRPGRVPADVSLPRSIWLYVSHCLQAQESAVAISGVAQKGNRVSNTDLLSSQQCDRLDLVLALVREIYACLSASKEGRMLSIPCEYVPLAPDMEEGAEDVMTDESMHQEEAEIFDDDDDNAEVQLYDSICLVVLTRMLQRKKLRPHVVRVLTALPKIPLACVHMLELLLLTGTKSASQALTQFGVKKRGPGADHGMRVVALEIMSSLLLHDSCMQDSSLFRACLFPLLWVATSEDFQFRNAAVNALVGVANKIEREYEPGEGLSFVRTSIIIFSLQQALSVVGITAYKLRLEQRGIECHSSDEKYTTDDAILGLMSELDFENSVDLVTAAVLHDNGLLFGRKFSDVSGVRQEADVEAFAKRSLHLLLQLSLCRPNLLVSLLDLYGTARGLQQYQLGVGIDQVSTAFKSNLKSLPANCGEVLCSLLQTEVLNITPAVTSTTRDTDKVFELLLQADTQALPMLILVLNSVLVDLEIPASDHMVEIVKSFYDSLPPANKDIRLLIPILGGMRSQDVENLLPRLIIDLLQSESAAEEGGAVKANEFMRKCILRITRARPPPLSRASLLVSLHRIDNEAHNINLKTLLETIGLCLSAKDEFKSDVIREAVTTLLEDPVPPKALMRTVILSAQSLPDIKKFVLAVVVPKLIMKRTWEVAPKVWDGVVMCVKNMAGHRDSEPTIRALIGLPVAQLRGILKIAPDTGVYLGRLLRSLSTEEVEEALSGKWAGLEGENSESQRKEKEKLIRETSSSAMGSAGGR